MYIIYLLLGIPIFTFMFGFTPTDPRHIFDNKVCEQRVRHIFGDIEQYQKHPFLIGNLIVNSHDTYYVYKDANNLFRQVVFKESIEGSSGRTLASFKGKDRYIHQFTRYRDLVNNIVLIESNGKIQSVSFQDKAFCEFHHNIKCTCE
jgi:hypothetical protein